MASPVKPMRPTDEIRWSWQIIGDESLQPDSPDPLPRLQQNQAAGINSSFAVNLTELVQRGRKELDFKRAWQRLKRAAAVADNDPVTAPIIYDQAALGLAAPAAVATVAAHGASVQRQGDADVISAAPGGWALLRVAELRRRDRL